MSDEPATLDFPPGLSAPGTADAPYRPIADASDIPPDAMRRLSVGDLDVLLANTERGLVAIDDRCPHMSAPLSLGSLDRCVVECPLHRGSFDLATGECVRFPTTGGLDANGEYHAPWQPEGSPTRPEPTDAKVRARALTRVRRLRYYLVRVRDGRIEVALPVE